MWEEVARAVRSGRDILWDIWL